MFLRNIDMTPSVSNGEGLSAHEGGRAAPG